MKRRECGGKAVVPSLRAVSAARSVLIAHGGNGRGGGAILINRALTTICRRVPRTRDSFSRFLLTMFVLCSYPQMRWIEARPPQGTMRTRRRLSPRNKGSFEKRLIARLTLQEKKGWRPSAFHAARNRFAPCEAERSSPRRSLNLPAPGLRAREEACFSFTHLRLVGPLVPCAGVKARSMPSSKAPALHPRRTDRGCRI